MKDSNLTDRKTMETDAAAKSGAYFSGGDFTSTNGKQLVHITFARRLERERDEARKQRDAWKASHDNQVKLRRMLMDRPDLGDRAKSMQELISECDALREALAELTPLAHIHQAQPENMTELDFYNLVCAIEDARAILDKTKP